MSARASTTPFLFGEDLGQPDSARQSVADLQRIHEEQQRELLEREAFERGRLAGRAEAEAETGRLRVIALDRIAKEAGRAITTVDGQAAVIEGEAIEFFTTLAKTLAGRAIAREPLATITDGAREAFRHLRGVPHLVARVHESLVEDVDAALRVMAREHGFEGRIVVIGSDDIAIGDARLDWADGAVLAERSALDAAVEAVLAHSAHDTPTGDSAP